MKIILAPDSFKGSLSAIEVCSHLEEGIKRVFPDAEISQLPVSDGGEGLVEVMVAATNGKIKKIQANDPLERPIETAFGILGNGHTAVIEMAAASGLPLLTKEEQNPLKTSTYGTGQLIKAALDENVNKIIIGIGGSATVDGGTGMAAALGAKFFDADGKELSPSGGAISKLDKIDVSGIDPRLKDVEIEVACDVDNPLTGDTGAARIYGPQKGATPEMVEILESNLSKLAEHIRQDIGIDVENEAGAGAAGGLGAGLLAFTGGKLVSGIDIALNNIDFDTNVQNADLVITGEGRIDHQTFFGKVPVGVSTRAEKFGVPVIAIGGGLEGRMEELHTKNIAAYFSTMDSIQPEEEVFARSPELIATCAEQVMRVLKLGNTVLDSKL